MALAASIYLNYPYMAVSQTASIYNIALPTNDQRFTFGYVEQGNFQTQAYFVGDRILYPQRVTDPVVIINAQQYSLINENDIILREPIDEPL